MTKSPLKLAKQALAVAKDALPAYASPYSKKTYTQHQLFALPAVRAFLTTDYRGLEQCLHDWSDLRGALGLSRVPRPLHPPEGVPTPPGKKGADALLGATVAQARSRRLIRPKPRAAVDATGFEAPHTSRYYAWRAGKRRLHRWGPKLTAVLDTTTHLFLSAVVSRGPGQDSAQFKPAVRTAAGRCPLDTLLGDSASDAEHNHAFGRDGLRIRSTVFPLNRRNTGRKWPTAKYRRQMVKRFRTKPRRSRHRRVSGQRWQIESGFSRLKRLLGSALRARRWVNQKKETLLRVITHNLLILAA